MSMRESFEKWATAERYKFVWDSHNKAYTDWLTHRAWLAYQAAYNMQQAEIDRLMLEYCPDEMSSAQLAEWVKHQRRVDDITDLVKGK